VKKNADIYEVSIWSKRFRFKLGRDVDGINRLRMLGTGWISELLFSVPGSDQTNTVSSFKLTVLKVR
jgi:hypothetical protein